MDRTPTRRNYVSMKLQAAAVDVASALNLQGARGLQWKTSLILLGETKKQTAAPSASWLT